MNEFNSSSLDSNSIVDILTLRYNPIQKPLLQRLTSKDFEPTNLEPSVEYIEKSIGDSIQKKFQTGVKKISIALSGGVDSALMLAIFHSLFPDIKIHATSIRFANSVDETPVATKIS